MTLRKSFMRLTTAAALAGAFVAACATEPDEPVERAHDPELDEADAQVDDAIEEGPPPIAVLEPAKDYKVSFILLEGSDGVRGVGIAEEMSGGTPSVIDSLGLGNANPLEVFLALSDEGVAVPAALTELYGHLPPTLPKQRRGSAVEAAGTVLLAGDVACDDTEFDAFVIESLPNDTWRLNHDATQPQWENYCDSSIAAFGPCGNCFNASRRRYEHTVYDVDEWRAFSCLRSGGTHLWACSSGSGTLALRVHYRFRDSNNNGWNTAFSSPNQNFLGQNKKFSWHWFTGANWDWLHTVNGAYPSGDDKVDLYTGWQQ